MQTKPGVRLFGMRPELLYGLIIADQVYREYDETMVVTSVTDGSHMPGSFHHVGLAGDLRLPNNLEVAIVRGIKERLGTEWDIVLEETCIHMEYDLRKLNRG